MKERNCQYCNKPYLSIRWNKKYCSKECSFNAWKIWKKNVWDPKYLPMPEVKEKYSLYYKKYYSSPKGKKNARKVQDHMLEKYPEKWKARRLMQYAVTCGKLIKPDKCSKCGDITIGKKLQGHHEDYSKPLEVVWVCFTCHYKIHHEVK